MRDAVRGRLGELRHEPTDKWVRARLGDRTVVDSRTALLVWEPRRVVPGYAVPDSDVAAELVPASPPAQPEPRGMLHPGIPFAVHSTAGEPLSVRVDGDERPAAAFRPADPDLAGYVALDFAAFDAWYEEDEQLIGHPRDPYHRVDIRPSTRQVRVEVGGRLVADSARPTLVFETSLPTRFYLPREDVVADLRPSEHRTVCPYKGVASYWSLDAHPDIAWTYRDPLPDAGRLTGLVAFFDEFVDIDVDGVPRPRPVTEWSKGPDGEPD